MTLDDIEHRILRPEFKDARIHFAINCASMSCPVLADRPYVAGTLGADLDQAAGRYLASAEGARLDGAVVRVSSIFDWYGDDFIPEYASIVSGQRAAKARAILGALARFAPAPVAAVAKAGTARVRFLPYDWSLNDIAR